MGRLSHNALAAVDFPVTAGNAHTRSARLVCVDPRSACESSFGFFQFPEHIMDIHEKTLAKNGVGDRW